MQKLLFDLRFALRSMRRHAAFSIVAAFTLSLGIGSTTAIFSMVNGVVLRPLPYADSEQLFRLWSTNREGGVDRGDVSAPDMLDLASLSRTVSDLAGYYPYDATWMDEEGNAIKLMGAAVSGNFFDLLGVNAILGRTFTQEEGEPGTTQVIVIGHGAWQNLYGGNPDIIGRSVTIEGGALTVVGVAPPGFDYPEGSQGWINFGRNPAGNRRARFWKVVGRLNPGVPLETAHADLTAVTRRLEEENPGTNEGVGVTTISLRDSILGNMGSALMILLGAAGVLLLIACANVANLLLARGSARSRELSLRAALGAGRARIVMQLLTESSTLALVGAAVGLAGAWAGIKVLTVMGPPSLTRFDAVGIDGTVLLFALGATVVTGLLFGLVPALRLGTMDLRGALSEGGRGGSSGKGSGYLRNLLVVAELSMAVVLVIGAGLLVRSFAGLQTTELGFESEDVLAFELALPMSQYDDYNGIADFYNQLVAGLEADPRVESAAVASTLPLGPQVDFLFPVVLEGRPAPLPGEEPQAYVRQVSPDFFTTMEIPVTAGRLFDSNDHREQPGVAIISERFAQLHYQDQNPIGERISGLPPTVGPLGRIFNAEVEIVGVTKDVRFGSVAEPPPLSIFLPSDQAPFRRMTVVAKAQSDPLQLISVARREVTALDPGLALGRTDSMERILSASLAGERFSMLLLVFFAVTALILASVGIYGVISYGVEQRTTEMAIRMAIGARPVDVLNMIVKQGATLAGISIAGGLFAAWASSNVIASQLHEVSARDPLIFLGVAFVLSVVAILATLLPAVRATRVSPGAALKPD